MKFAVITLPYSVDTHKGAAAGPDALLQAGLADWLREEGHDVVGPVHVKSRRPSAHRHLHKENG